MKSKARLCIVMLILPVIFFGCIGISSEIWLHEDGSGKIQLEYRMPELLIESLKNSDSAPDTVVIDGIEIFAFFSRHNIQDKIEDFKTLTLSDYRVWKKETDTYILFEILFSEIEELNSLELMPAVEIYYNKDGTVLFEQAVSLDSSLDSNDRKVYQVYKNYENSYTVHAPLKITYYNAGALSEDGKTVGLKHSLLFPEDNNSTKEADLQEKLTVEW
ncbi:MAG: hypothetical protein JW864_08360 [Spirochaetes bacterium]|nr:hypothetical protein [Spirochaetota bacterium]